MKSFSSLSLVTARYRYIEIKRTIVYKKVTAHYNKWKPTLTDLLEKTTLEEKHQNYCGFD